ncbi:hypothetical protein K438DRAFT_1758313 [Mycena galopus ATCC 62051]|nr:hypothetical protein K438DRAFT_1758313 [Mycena galopus ATCC 62051]
MKGSRGFEPPALDTGINLHLNCLQAASNSGVDIRRPIVDTVAAQEPCNRAWRTVHGRSQEVKWWVRFLAPESRSMLRISFVGGVAEPRASESYLFRPVPSASKTVDLKYSSRCPPKPEATRKKLSKSTPSKNSRDTTTLKCWELTPNYNIHRVNIAFLVASVISGMPSTYASEEARPTGTLFGYLHTSDVVCETIFHHWGTPQKEQIMVHHSALKYDTRHSLDRRCAVESEGSPNHVEWLWLNYFKLRHAPTSCNPGRSFPVTMTSSFVPHHTDSLKLQSVPGPQGVEFKVDRLLSLELHFGILSSMAWPCLSSSARLLPPLAPAVAFPQITPFPPNTHLQGSFHLGSYSRIANLPHIVPQIIEYDREDPAWLAGLESTI